MKKELLVITDQHAAVKHPFGSALTVHQAGKVGTVRSQIYSSKSRGNPLSLATGLCLVSQSRRFLLSCSKVGVEESAPERINRPFGPPQVKSI